MSGIRIVTADPTGQCFGVKRAIEAIERALSAHGTVYAVGSPIHNPQEVVRLTEQGMIVVNSVEEIPDRSVVFIRAHGVVPDTFERLRAKNCKIVDGTCPFVRLLQKRARELSDSGYHLLILGNPQHPEIAGILGYIHGDSTVISSLSSFWDSTICDSSVRILKLGLVSQTTQQECVLKEIAKAAVGFADELRIYNTICHATVERQQAVRQLAGKVDGVIIIGGRNSANTGKLFGIARDSGCPTLWIEQACELEADWLDGKSVIGIAAGASTPDWLILQLKNAIESIAGRQGDVSYE